MLDINELEREVVSDQFGGCGSQVLAPLELVTGKTGEKKERKSGMTIGEVVR